MYGIFTNIYLDFGGFLWGFHVGKYTSSSHGCISKDLFGSSAGPPKATTETPKKTNLSKKARRRAQAKEAREHPGLPKLRFGIWTTQKIPKTSSKTEPQEAFGCPEKVGFYDLFHGELGMK